MSTDDGPGARNREIELRERLTRAEQALREEGYHELANELTLGLLHKLNNLMTGVYFHLESMEEAVGHEHPARAAVAALSETVRDAQMLVRRTVDLNLPPDDEASYHEVGALLHEHWELVKLVLSKSAVAEFIAPAQPFHVRLSSEEFREALLQLALSTREAAPGAHTHVSVRVTAAEELDLTEFRPAPPHIPGGVAVLYRDNAGQQAMAPEQFPFGSFLPERGGGMNRLFRADTLIKRQNGILAVRQLSEGVEYLILIPLAI